MTSRRDIANSAADPRPRYRQISDDLLAQIRGGQHAIGTMLPTETELCALYSASRHTVREALRLVEEAGLVARRQGSGTTVIAHENRGRFVQDLTSMGGLLQYPEETRLTVLRAREVPASEVPGVPEGEAWLRIEGIRRVRLTTAPICFVIVHIPTEYAAVIEEIGQQPGSLYALIERRFGVQLSSVEVDLSAGGVPQAQAALLEVDPGAAALMIRRRYFDQNGRVFEVSEGCHPAPRFTYRAMIKREV
ncbi:GntR family transcriptional regulator [Sediminicoccus sp. KRV36]|uniref:GntR family transcriptional regulator n=1 Tax=Sediminicoccus sp. KRV36 TaxID=3133721 RepID=UPI00200D3BCC|nr:GntR family transcriptional regulator [Sediminicoccus rosea]UPY36292.1 GntR family transcriptional regulator [Sediminicoccus rosea]